MRTWYWSMRPLKIETESRPRRCRLSHQVLVLPKANSSVRRLSFLSLTIFMIRPSYGAHGLERASERVPFGSAIEVFWDGALPLCTLVRAESVKVVSRVCVGVVDPGGVTTMVTLVSAPF